MDYSEGIRKQDLSVSSYALDAGKGIILVINKVDLMDDPEHDEARMIRLLRHKFDFLPWAAVIFVSALEKKNVEMILTIAQQVQAERMRQVSDESLGFFLKDVTFKHHPPAMSGRLPKFYDLKQVGVNPPRFEYTVNNSDIIHFSYRRYLENELRKKYGFTGTSIKLHFRKKARKIE
jgi:GTP-binding protein